MDTNSDKGSYCQLNTFEDGDNNFRANGRTRKLRGSRIRRVPKSRTLFRRRDCILVTVVMACAVLVIAFSLGFGIPRIHANRLQYYDPTIKPSDSKLYTFSSAALASDGGPCAAIGKSILQRNGSAVDAAIAMVFCGGVVNPTSTGLGGGFFMTIYKAGNKSVEIIDAREEAPSNATVDMFKGNATLSKRGGLSIAVPGELRGLGLAHQRHGVLNWSDLVMPSVKLCLEGVLVSKYMAGRLHAASQYLLADPGLRSEFMNNATGTLYLENEVMKRPHYGATLEKIAVEGWDIMYNGSLAEVIAKEIQQNGGIISVEDLSNYKAIVREPISVSLKGGKETLYSVPPPGCGAVLAGILSALDSYGLTTANVTDSSAIIETYHTMIEAFKFAFGLRSKLGDPQFDQVSETVKNLTSPEFGSWVRSRITANGTHPPEYYGAQHMPDDHGTAHCQVLAANGDAVSVTSTVNTQFGSKFASPTLGIIYNDQMDDFSSPNITNTFGVVPSPSNHIQPGKRPLSSMSPSIVVDQATGKVRMVIGANGGTRIITAMAQVMSGVMWLGQDVKQAIDTPRFHHQLLPNVVQHEKDFPEVYIDGLQKLGHKTRLDPEGSVVLGIVRTEFGSIQANVDYRKGGSAEGL